MKLLFQFIGHKSGTRSEVLEMSRQSLAQSILRTQHMYRDMPDVLANTSNDYVLVLMEKPATGQAEEYSFSLAPVMTAADFLTATMTEQEQSAFLLELDKISDEKLQEQYA